MNLQPISSIHQSKSVSFQVDPPSLSLDLDSYVSEIIKLSESPNYSRKNLRFCFHRPNTSNLHQMLILERKQEYYPPHIHKNRDEMHLVLHGSLEIYLLNPDGSHHSSSISNESFNTMTTVFSNSPHLTRPHTSFVVYLECKNGIHSNFQEECFEPDPSLGSNYSYMEYLSSHLT